MAIEIGKVVIAGALLAASTGVAYGAEDDSGDGSHASLAIDVDQEDSRYLDGLLGLSFGSGWAELRLGKLTAESEGSGFNATTAAFGAGYQGAAISVSGGYSYREDSDSLGQRDLKGDITYQGGAGSIGVDVFLRSADYETVASVDRRLRDPVAIRIADSIEGRGVGLHGNLYVSPRLTLFAAAMSYDYDEPGDLPAGVTRWERIFVSGITRDDVWLQDTVNVGATYDFNVLKLTADFTRDTTLYNDEQIVTTSLLARVPSFR